MAGCNNGTVIPTNDSPLLCDEFTSSDCIIFQEAIVYLELPPNSTATEVFVAMLASLIDARNRILNLETNL